MFNTNNDKNTKLTANWESAAPLCLCVNACVCVCVCMLNVLKPAKNNVDKRRKNLMKIITKMLPTTDSSFKQDAGQGCRQRGK